MVQIYNMPSGAPFLHSLAKGLDETFGDELQDGLILLPTRRASRGLADAFVRQASEKGVQATLLPRFRPLADVNPDEPPFEPGELAGRIAPAIDPIQRRFEIAKLVAQYHERASDLPLDPATALQMADPLIDIMDDAALEEVGLSDHEEWKHICAEAAIHFQHAATLYQIVETYWPARLKELNLMDPSTRRVALLDALSDIWSETPPDYPVIIAGSTGTLKATARLMTVVANMPKGMVVLPGLQEDMPDKVWTSIDGRHPQASLKNLLTIMGLERGEVPNWPWIVSGQDQASARKRRRVLAEALVPVDATGDWLTRIETLNAGEGANVFETALAGLSLIEARTDGEEALAIALIMREALETSGKTAALVTPDQLLAQRVRARLSRWSVDVDMSQGVPVEQTPIGVFLTALLDLACDPQGPVELNMVLTHPISALEQEAGLVKTEWEALEKKRFRGVRPKPEEYERFPLVQSLYQAASALLEIDGEAGPDVWAAALIASAERIATTDQRPGTFRLWGDEAGRQAAKILEDIVAHGGTLPKTDTEGFTQLLSSLLQSAVVRPSQAGHPRLSILGPLEARMLDADIVILGGLNEGTWPSSINAGPFLSRRMREQMKLSLPERRYGLAAHDFAELAANETVYLTRSQKDETGPTVASRWVWRLKTLLAGTVVPHPDETESDLKRRRENRVIDLLGTGQNYLDWARQLDRPSDFHFIDRPNPKPPVDKRWARKNGRRMSITGASKWIRDPYSVFGKHVLRLDPLEPLDAPLDARQFGDAIHKAIELYILAVDQPHDRQNLPELIKSFETQLADMGYEEEEVFKEQPRLLALAEALISWFETRKQAGYDIVGPEIEASCELDDLNFALFGYLDLVERGPDGFAFTDFKTGQPPSGAEVAAGFDLQLPLAGYMAAQGALTGVKAGPTSEMGYIRAKGSGDDFKYTRIDGEKRKLKPADILIEQAIDILRKLIIAFDQPETGYPSQPRAKYTNKWGDYDDLARRAEWSSVAEGEE